MPVHARPRQGHRLLPAAARDGPAPCGRAWRMLRMFDPRFQGQLTTAELIGQYDLACAPVRDLLVSYLNERQPAIDYATLKQPRLPSREALLEGPRDLHHPGISSLRLAPDAAIAWKQRLQVKHRDRPATRPGTPPRPPLKRIDVAGSLARPPSAGSTSTSPSGPRKTRPAGRSGQRPRRSAGKTSPARHRRPLSRRKSRMDQRTRERIPVLPALISVVDQGPRKDAAARLAAAAAAAPGGPVHRRLPPLRRTALTSTAGPQANGRTWAEDPVTGTRRDLAREELARRSGPGPQSRCCAPPRHPRRGADRALAPQPGPLPAARC